MAGKFKGKLRRAGWKALYVLKLLVLAFWIGGGAVMAGVILTPFLERQFAEKAGEIAKALLGTFSITELISGGLLCILLFIFDRKRLNGRLTLGFFGLLVVATATNHFILGVWRGFAPSDPIYQGIFMAEIAVALAAFAVLALKGAYLPEEASPKPEEAPVPPPAESRAAVRAEAPLPAPIPAPLPAHIPVPLTAPRTEEPPPVSPAEPPPFLAAEEPREEPPPPAVSTPPQPEGPGR